jgi:hypothetical protein
MSTVSAFHAKAPLWDLTLPDALALHKYLKHSDAYATAAFRPHNPHGVSYLLYSAARYLELKGLAPEILLAPAQLAANATAADIENHREAKTNYKLQETQGASVTYVIEAGYPQHIRALIEQDHSLDHLTLSEQFEQLQQLLPLSYTDFEFMSIQIEKPYLPTIKIDTFSANQLQHLKYLSDAGQPIQPLEAVKKMYKAYTSTPDDLEDFSQAMKEFVQQFGSVAQQTPTNFAAFMNIFVRERLPIYKEANAKLRAANAALFVLDNETSNAALAVTSGANANLEKQLQQLIEVIKSHEQNSNRNSKGKKKYCWTHGTCLHSSNECRSKASGHKDEASFKNQLGGKKL